MIVPRTLQALLIIGLLSAVSCGTASVTETASTDESPEPKTTTGATSTSAPPSTSTTSPRKPAKAESTKADSPANTTASSQNEIFFPTQKDPQRDAATAMGSGQLILTNDGCLRLKAVEDYPSRLLIWPPNYSLNTEGNRVRIMNENGQIAAEVGDEMRVSGGELWSLQVEAIPESSRQELSERCPPPYWLTGFEVDVVEE